MGIAHEKYAHTTKVEIKLTTPLSLCVNHIRKFNHPTQLTNSQENNLRNELLNKFLFTPHERLSLY